MGEALQRSIGLSDLLVSAIYWSRDVPPVINLARKTGFDGRSLIDVRDNVKIDDARSITRSIESRGQLLLLWATPRWARPRQS
jgi:hypothetical protein